MGKNDSMTRTDMITIIANKTGLDKGIVERVLDCFLDTVVEELAHNRSVRLSGFGSFENSFYKPRKLKSYFTGETVSLEQRVVPKFKPATKVKDYVTRKVSAASKTKIADDAV